MYFKLSNKTLSERYIVVRNKPWFVRHYKAFLTPNGAIVSSRYLYEPDIGFVFLIDKRDLMEFVPESTDIDEIYNEEINRGNGYLFDYNELDQFHIEGGIYV